MSTTRNAGSQEEKSDIFVKIRIFLRESSRPKRPCLGRLLFPALTSPETHALKQSSLEDFRNYITYLAELEPGSIC